MYNNSFVLKGEFCKLRLVTLKDAEFILYLRTLDCKSLYLNKTENDIDKQVDWLKKYKVKEENQEEFYFIIEDGVGELVGTYRLCNITKKSATPGSWIIKDGVDFRVAIESVLLMYDFVFNTLRKEKIEFDVRKRNKKVIRFHESYGSIKIAEEGDDNFYKFESEQFSAMNNKFKNLLK